MLLYLQHVTRLWGRNSIPLGEAGKAGRGREEEEERFWVTHRSDKPVQRLSPLCVFHCDGAQVVAEPDRRDDAAGVAVGYIFLRGKKMGKMAQNVNNLIPESGKLELPLWVWPSPHCFVAGTRWEEANSEFLCDCSPPVLIKQENNLLTA